MSLSGCRPGLGGGPALVEVAAWRWRHPLTQCTLDAQPHVGARTVLLGSGCGSHLGDLGGLVQAR